jgi:hypothetical protein
MLSLKTDVNIATVRKKKINFEEKKLTFCWHHESHRQKEQDPEPDQ